MTLVCVSAYFAYFNQTISSIPAPAAADSHHQVIVAGVGREGSTAASSTFVLYIKKSTQRAQTSTKAAHFLLAVQTDCRQTECREILCYIIAFFPELEPWCRATYCKSFRTLCLSASIQTQP